MDDYTVRPQAEGMTGAGQRAWPRHCRGRCCCAAGRSGRADRGVGRGTGRGRRSPADRAGVWRCVMAVAIRWGPGAMKRHRACWIIMSRSSARRRRTRRRRTMEWTIRDNWTMIARVGRRYAATSVVAELRDPRRRSVAGRCGEGAGRMAGHRPGRHAESRRARDTEGGGGRGRGGEREKGKEREGGKRGGRERERRGRWGGLSYITPSRWTMLLRPGNAAQHTFTDHSRPDGRAIRKIPSRSASYRLMVRVDGGAAMSMV